jgi:lysophospholipase L1-like esterase
MDGFGAVLRPVMQRKARAIHQSTAIPRPDHATGGETPGPDPDRVLLLGNGALAGWGVESHDQAVPGHLARQLSELTGHPVVVDLVADHTVRAGTALQLIPHEQLAEYDAIVIVLGASDALQMLPTTHWVRDISSFLDALAGNTPSSTEIVVMGIQPPSTVPVFDIATDGIVDQKAARFNDETKTLCTGRIHYLQPPVLPRIGPSTVDPDSAEEKRRVSDGYREWAKTMAQRLAALRASNPSWS